MTHVFDVVQILKGAPVVDGRPGASMEPLDFAALKEDLVAKHGEYITEKDQLSAALYPKVFDDFQEFKRTYGPVDKLDTKTFLVGPDIAQEMRVSVAGCRMQNVQEFCPGSEGLRERERERER